MLTMVDLIERLNDGNYLTWIGDKYTIYNKLGQVVDKEYGEPIELTPVVGFTPGVGRRCGWRPGYFGYVIINREILFEDSGSGKLTVQYALYDNE